MRKRNFFSNLRRQNNLGNSLIGSERVVVCNSSECSFVVDLSYALWTTCEYNGCYIMSHTVGLTNKLCFVFSVMRGHLYLVLYAKMQFVASSVPLERTAKPEPTTG